MVFLWYFTSIMKLIIKNLAIVCGFVLFSSQAVAQTNRPIRLKRCSFDSVEYTKVWRRRQLFTLREDFFPWGVCLGDSTTSNTEDDWTREAMQIWNRDYNQHVYNTWGTLDVVNIPKGPLFVESCNRRKHNIIYIEKDDLSGDDPALAYYSPRDYWWDFLW